MASSSVSQDDVDNNYEKNSRRSRIRTARARQINPSGCRLESQAIGDTDDGTICLEEATRHISVSAPGESTFGNVEHETSPKPILRSGGGSKDAKRSTMTKPPHHVNKGKQQRDRRKLREKRRSTGVVHLASTESTGGSTTGDDEESSDAAHVAASVAGGGTLSAETRKNTMQNEMPLSAMDIAKEHLMATSSGFKMQYSSSDLSNGGGGVAFLGQHHHHHASRCATAANCSTSSSHRRDKSPSDLEADDENDHDSLNQSEGSCSHEPGSTTTCLKSNKFAATAQFSGDQVAKVIEENRRLMQIVEERDRRIHMLEFKVQQLMRDTLTISEEQARLQKENTTLLRALSKLTSERNAHRKPQVNGDEV